MFGTARRGGPSTLLPTPIHSILLSVTETTEHRQNYRRFLFGYTKERVIMYLPANRKQGRLPKRFPVGTTYVVEGRGDPEGHLCVFSRYVVLPGGERINLAADLSAAATPRNRRVHCRGPRAAQKGAPPRTGKQRAERTKKIMATAGTTRSRRR
jgi:hypothetical protein